MRLTQDQISAVQQSVRNYIEKASVRYNKQFPIPVVRFDLRGRTGGQALIRENVVRVNSVLLAENFERYVKQTIGHEVAHLIAHAQFGAGVGRRIKPHGYEWQSVMHVFGLPADRCHQYDTSNARIRQTRKYAYSCNCKVHEVGPTVSRKIAMGHKYSCNSCKGVLKAGTQIGGSELRSRQIVQRVSFSTLLEQALGLHD